MNKNGIRWNRLFAVPHGKEIVIVDDGDTYTFDEFDELAGETCELTQEDERLLKMICASQDEAESDKWRMCTPESVYRYEVCSLPTGCSLFLWTPRHLNKLSCSV